QQLKNVKRSFDNLKRKFDKLKEEKMRVDQELKQSKAEIIKANKSQRGAQWEQFFGQFKDAKTKHTTMMKKIKKYEESADARKGEMVQTKGEISELRNKLGEEKEKVSDLQQRLAEEKEKVSELQKKFERKVKVDAEERKVKLTVETEEDSEF